MYSKLITRKYESTTGLPGRSAGFSIGVTGTPTADYDLTYGYESTTGRLSTFTGTTGIPIGLPAGGVTYTRTANSNLIHG